MVLRSDPPVVRLLTLGRRRSRVPWIFQVYHRKNPRHDSAPCQPDCQPSCRRKNAGTSKTDSRSNSEASSAPRPSDAAEPLEVEGAALEGPPEARAEGAATGNSSRGRRAIVRRAD